VGLRRGRILNVDHHAALAVMESQQRTSTQLAYEYLQGRGASAASRLAEWL